MIWKKLMIAFFALLSVPLVIITGSFIAELVYNRLLFEGYNVTDLMPGDGGGVSFLTWISWAALLLLDLAFWRRVYRRISR